jgi:hypothetical protein
MTRFRPLHEARLFDPRVPRWLAELLLVAALLLFLFRTQAG